MKTTLLTIALIFSVILVFPQMENSAFTETGRGASFAFVTDYQALGVNPANLGFGNRYDKQFTLGLGQFGLSFYSEAFTRDLMYALRDDRPNISLVMGLLRFRFGSMEQGTPSRMY